MSTRQRVPRRHAGQMQILLPFPPFSSATRWTLQFSRNANVHDVALVDFLVKLNYALSVGLHGITVIICQVSLPAKERVS